MRRALKTEGDLGVVFARFMDLVDQPGFMTYGKKAIHGRLKQVLVEFARRLYPNNAPPLQHLMMYHCKSLGLYHGICMAGGRQVVFFYFPSLDQGMIAIPTGHIMHYGRFSVVVPTSETPIVPSQVSTTLH